MMKQKPCCVDQFHRKKNMLSLLAPVPLMCMVRGEESITQGCSIIYLFPASFDCVGFKSHEMRIVELLSIVQY